LNNSNFENFADDGVLSKENENRSYETTSIEDTQSIMVSQEYKPPEIDLVNDGSTQATPLKNPSYAFTLISVQENKEGNIWVPKYKDGYYWINIPNVGSKYIYCIMDKNYFGGGWMLAMRAVYDSKNFSYDSKYFDTPATLNSTSTDIDNIIKDEWKKDPEKTQLQISSIGDLIYKTNIDPAKYDAKFETFNNSPANEWMAIFYVKNPDNGKVIIGGDLSEAYNKRGWIWREKNVVKNEFANGVNKVTNLSPLDFFKYNKNKAIKLNVKEIYGLEYAQNLLKFINPPLTGDKVLRNQKNQIFSGQVISSVGNSFYGMNYDQANNLSKVRWGFTFNDAKDNTNDVVGGIGTSYKKQDKNGKPDPTDKSNGFSAGNFEMTGKDVLGNDINPDTKFTDRPISKALRNSSYAVEWYIREKTCN